MSGEEQMFPASGWCDEDGLDDTVFSDRGDEWIITGETGDTVRGVGGVVDDLVEGDVAGGEIEGCEDVRSGDGLVVEGEWGAFASHSPVPFVEMWVTVSTGWDRGIRANNRY